MVYSLIIGRKLEVLKKEKEKPSTGIILIACLNFFFAIIASLLGSVAILSSFLLAGALYIKALALLVSGIGLWELRFWAWLLTVIICLFSLIAFVFNPNAIPLELIVLPYLLIERKKFDR